MNDSSNFIDEEDEKQSVMDSIETIKDSILPKFFSDRSLDLIKKEIIEHIDKIKIANKKPEYILCSAIYYNDEKQRPNSPRNIKNGIVVTGLRHNNCIHTLHELFGNEWRKSYTSGFLTSENRFVEREEAANIAYNANQTKDRLKTLYSEDLW